MLTVPVIEGTTLVLVASKGGDDRDPDWFRNLLANPVVEVVRGPVRVRMRSRLATPVEQARLWPLVVATYRSYDTYRTRSSRQIPLVICAPDVSAR